MSAGLGRGCPACTWWPTALQLHPLSPSALSASEPVAASGSSCVAKGVGSRAPQPLSLTRVPHPEVLFSCTPKWVSEDKIVGAAVPRHHSTEQACCSHRGSFSREPGLAWTRVRPPAAALVEARRPRRKGAGARTCFVVVRAQDEAGPGPSGRPCPARWGEAPLEAAVSRHWAAPSPEPCRLQEWCCPSGAFSTAQPCPPPQCGRELASPLRSSTGTVHLLPLHPVQRPRPTACQGWSRGESSPGTAPLAGTGSRAEVWACVGKGWFLYPDPRPSYQ